MGLFETLTLPAKEVLARATEAATEMGSAAVEAGHLLLGFLEVDGTPARMLLSHSLPDAGRVRAEVQRLTVPSTDGAHPGFGEEVCLVLAAARGIAKGRSAAVTGTAACLAALLMLGPNSATEVLQTLGADVEELATAASAGLNADDTEALVSSGGVGLPWAVTIGTVDPAVAWSDERP